jgi:hypothetical protein
MAVSELELGKSFYGNRDMLFLAAGIGKAQVHKLDLFILDYFEYISGRRHFSLLKLKVQGIF